MKVYSHPDHGETTVKEGFSWPGFFFTFGWALLKNLWGHAIALGVLLAGSRLTSIYFERRFDANPNDGVAAAVIIGAMIVLIGTCIIVGWYGNRWVEQALIAKGYTHTGTRDA